MVWAASLAWVIEVFMLLGALRRRHSLEHKRLLAPFPWNWTVLFNPIAIVQLFVFVLSHRDDKLSDPHVSRLAGGMRLTLALVAAGWVVLIGLLVVVGPESLAA